MSGSAGFAARSQAWKGRNIKYRAAHMRVFRYRGRASNFTCACGNPAQDWAYDYSDPDQLTGPNGKYQMVYSPDITRYAPMCRPCHTTFDREHQHGKTQLPGERLVV